MKKEEATASRKNRKQPSPDKQGRRRRWAYILSGIIILGMVSGYFLFPGFQGFVDDAYAILISGDDERLTAYVESFGAWGPVFIVLAMCVQMFLIVVPSWLLMIVAALAYGPVWGALLSVAAVFTASTFGYFVGSTLNEVTIDRMVGEEEKKKMKHYIGRYGFGAVILFRLAPFLSNDAISFVGGMLRMGYWKFIGATLAGIIPLAALIGYFGQDTDTLKTGLVWVGGLSLVLYAGYIVYEQLRAK